MNSPKNLHINMHIKLDNATAAVNMEDDSISMPSKPYFLHITLLNNMVTVFHV